MNQPMAPPATMSDAECWRAPKRAALTIVARPYAKSTTGLLSRY
jgi:hypothetical protein